MFANNHNFDCPSCLPPLHPRRPRTHAAHKVSQYSFWFIVVGYSRPRFHSAVEVPKESCGPISSTRRFFVVEYCCHYPIHRYISTTCPTISHNKKTMTSNKGTMKGTRMKPFAINGKASGRPFKRRRTFKTPFTLTSTPTANSSSRDLFCAESIRKPVEKTHCALYKGQSLADLLSQPIEFLPATRRTHATEVDMKLRSGRDYERTEALQAHTSRVSKVSGTLERCLARLLGLFGLTETPQLARVKKTWPPVLRSRHSRGLRNPHNWCYRRGAQQSLAHQAPLYNWLLKQHLNCTNQVCALCDVRDFLKAYWGDVNFSHELREVDWWNRSTTSDLMGPSRNQQEDCYLYYLWLLERIRQDADNDVNA